MLRRCWHVPRSLILGVRSDTPRPKALSTRSGRFKRPCASKQPAILLLLRRQPRTRSTSSPDIGTLLRAPGRPGGISSSQLAVLRFHPPASNYEIPDHMSTPRGNAPLRLASNARAWVVWYWDTTSVNDVHFGIEGANP